MPKRKYSKSARKKSGRTWFTKSFKQRGAIRLGSTMKLVNPRAMIVIAGVLLVGVLAVVYSLASGSPEIKSFLADNKCLDNYQDKSLNGDKADSYTCNGTAAQRWDLEPNGTITLHNKCLDVYQAKKTNGALIDLYTCDGGSNQKWSYNSVSHELISKASGKCLEVPGASLANGIQLQIWTCVDDTQQKWSFTTYSPVSPITPATPLPNPVSTPVSTPKLTTTPVSTPKPTATPVPTPKPTTTPTPTATADGCTAAGVVAPCMNGTGSGTGSSGYGEPVFDDEFNDTSVNTSVWNLMNGDSMNDVTTYASNVSESGGDLILTLASSSSGAEVVANNYSLPVGSYIEARIDFPGNGTTIYNWPAWWVSGPNWPAAGENDIAEGLGTLTVNYHSPSGSHNQGTVPGVWSNGFHTYGLYRGSNYSEAYWDGTLVKKYNTDDNGQPENVIFNVGCAGDCVTPSQVKVDYVRAWK